MHEREHDTDRYWTDDRLIGDAPVHTEPLSVHLQLHRSEEPYRARNREEIYPLTHRTGTRAYVHAKPYVLEPEITLSVGLSPIKTDWVEMRQRDIGQAQAWYYPADQLLVLWECSLFDHARQDEPTADELLATVWAGFEDYLRTHFPHTQRIATPSWEDLYEKPAWQLFLGGLGYGPFSPGAFVKELPTAGDAPSPSSHGK